MSRMPSSGLCRHIASSRGAAPMPFGSAAIAAEPSVNGYDMVACFIFGETVLGVVRATALDRARRPVGLDLTSD